MTGTDRPCPTPPTTAVTTATTAACLAAAALIESSSPLSTAAHQPSLPPFAIPRRLEPDAALLDALTEPKGATVRSTEHQIPDLTVRPVQFRRMQYFLYVLKLLRCFGPGSDASEQGCRCWRSSPAEWWRSSPKLRWCGCIDRLQAKIQSQPCAPRCCEVASKQAAKGESLPFWSVRS